MIKRRVVAVSLLIALSASSAALFSSRVQAQQSDRAKQIGGKFMCMCSCNQVLTECNHVGCSTSAAMLKELNQSLSRGNSEDAITQMFVQEFGTRVYAEPPKSGFSLVAWALPSIYLFVGTGVVILVISRWRKRPAQQVAPAGGAPGISAEVLERARAQASRETQD